MRLRTDVVVGGRVQVRVTDVGTEPFTVTAVALDSPGFAPLPPTPLTAEFTPGRVIDLPTPYGEPNCAAAPDPVSARLALSRPGGAVEEVRVPLAGDDLAVVHREECAVAGVLDVAGIALTGLVVDGEEATGSVVLTRRGDDDRAVTVVGVRPSVLVDVALDEAPVVLEGGEAEVSTPMTFTVATCEPHVLAETKQPFLFPLQVEVGDADAVPVPLPVDEAQEALLWAMVDGVCAQRR
ncbi:hypothetical protein [Geodermatophilus sabuli]|uniref:hypothetical protein n=1 Tax=Geodermatophilus sabuli TaxID=1564158 RepID=UPI00117B1C5F|nr:hypothetical protein [Geodermatophilus sabuli]